MPLPKFNFVPLDPNDPKIRAPKRPDDQDSQQVREQGRQESPLIGTYLKAMNTYDDLVPAMEEGQEDPNPVAGASALAQALMAGSAIFDTPDTQVRPSTPQAVPYEVQRLGANPQQLGRWDNFTNRLNSGFQNMQASLGQAVELAGGIGELVPGDQNWAEAMQNWGADIRDRNLAEAEELNARGQLARGDDFVGWGLGVIAETIPFMGAVAIGGTAAAVASPAAVSTALASFIGGSLFTYPAMMSDMRKTLEDEGMSADEAEAWASVTAIPLAISEAVLPAGAANRLIGTGTKRLLGRKVGQLAAGVSAQSLTEGGTESLQEAISIAATTALTDKEFDLGEAMANVGEAFLGGALVGGVFEGITIGAESALSAGNSKGETDAAVDADAAATFADESGLAEVLTPDLAAALSEGVANIEAKDLEIGAEIDGKYKDANGRWRNVEGKGFASAPTVEEIAAVHKDAIVDTEAVAGATPQTVPHNIPVAAAAQTVATIAADPTITPALVEVNVKANSTNYRSSAIKNVNSMEDAELQHKIATLEALATDPESGADYATRVAALSNIRALESAILTRDAEVDVHTPVDTSMGARAMAVMDDAEFEHMATVVSQSNNEILKKQALEAAAIRANSPNIVQNNADEVKKRLNKASAATSRGLKPGQSFITEEGEVMTVKGVRPSGFVEAIDTSGSGEIQVMDPAAATIIPNAGQNVKLTGGAVATITEVPGTDQVKAETASGESILIDLSSIESVDAVPGMAAAIQEQLDKVDEPTPEPNKVELLEPTTVTNKITGKTVEVVAAGQTELALADGTTMPRDQAQRPMTDESRFLANTGGEMPIFAPGTQPAREGNHINFLQIPAHMMDTMASAIQSANPALVQELLSKGKFTLLPQPEPINMRTFAIELPGEARRLTSGSKQALSFLSGKSDRKPGLATQVSLARDVTADEIAVMRVPTELLMAVSNESFIDRTPEQQREYLRRLTDLGFENNTAISDALVEAQGAAREARDLRIGGEDIGGAEMAEIAAVAARAEAALVTLEEDIKERKAAWEAMAPALRATMLPREINTLDVLNRTEEELLGRILKEDVKNVGDTLTEAILDARREAGEGGFGSVQQLLDIKGLGPATLTSILQAVNDGSISDKSVLTEQHEKELASFLMDLEPRRGPRDVSNLILSYEHPHIPGMHLIIDKEEIPTATGGRGNRRFTREEVRETLGGFVEEEFNGQPIQIDPLDQLDNDTLVRLMGGQQASTRTIYHISYITPEGQTVKSRTIDSDERSFQVPFHLGAETIDQRGGARPGRAVQELTKIHAEQGADALGPAVDAMQDRRRKTTMVKLEGEESFVEVVEQVMTGDKGAREETNQFVVKDSEGRIFEIDGSKIVDSREELEGDVTVKMPIRFTPKQQAEEAVKMVRGFAPTTQFFSVGEYRSPVPGLYAEIRPTTIRVPANEVTEGAEGEVGVPGFRVMYMQREEGRVLETLRLFTAGLVRDFATADEARAFLSDRGFKKGKTSDNAAEIFASLPPVDTLRDVDLQVAHDLLTDVLEAYHTRGFYPQPVRDYAVRLAINYNDAGYTQSGGLFRSRAIRKDLKLYNAAELANAAEAVNNDFTGAITQSPKGTVFFQDGKLAIERPTPAEIASDIRPMDGILLGDNVELTHPAKLATAQALFEQTEHRMRFLDHIEHDGEPITQATQERLVEVGREKRLGVILEVDHTTGRMVVQVWRGGEPVTLEVRDKDVKRLRSPDKLNDYLRMVKENMGDITNLPATPTIGTSPYDAIMNNDGVTDPVAYAENLRMKVGEILKKVKVHKDGTISGDPTLMEPLSKIWIRMKELEIPNLAYYAETLDPTHKSQFEKKFGNLVHNQNRETRTGEPRRAKRSKVKEIFNEDGTRTQVEESTGNEPVVGSNTELTRSATLIPPVLLAPTVLGGVQHLGVIQELAYKEISTTFSPISAYGDLMAKAKLGHLPKALREQIIEQAKKFGVPTEGVPFYKVAEGMIQNVWDPNVANSMFQRRREIDLQTFATGIPASFKHGIQVRQPATGNQLTTTTAFGAWFAFPRTLANRHPTIKAFFTLLERHRLKHTREIKELDEVLLAANRFGREEKMLMREMWESPELGAAMSRPSDILSETQFREAAPELAAKADKTFKNRRWYDEYARTREILVKVRRWNIRNGLFRGFHAEELTMDASGEGEADNRNDLLNAIEELKKQNGITPAEYEAMTAAAAKGQKVYTLDRVSNPAHAKPQGQIDRFLDLTDTYESYADIPDAVRTNMEPWMVDEFDFWARYGFNNYAPHVLQGRHKIKIPDPEGGADIVVAVAPDGQSAQKFFFDVSRGRIEGITPEQTNDMYIDIGIARGDDLDMHYLGSSGFAQMYSELVTVLGGRDGKATEMARAAIKTLDLGSERAAPRGLHMQPRVANLHSLIEDPYKALKIYHDRTSRNNFLLNVNDAYSKAEAMDHHLSIGSGVMPIFKNRRAGTVGQKAARFYMKNLRDNAMGVQPAYEQVLSNAIAIASLDVRKVPGILQKMKNPNYDLFNDVEVFPLLYNEDFTLRETARKWNTFQSIFRLGGNIGGSAINAMQSLMFTPSNLMSHGYGAAESMKFMMQGYAQAGMYGISRAVSKDPKLAAFFEQVGVDNDAMSGSTVGLGMRKTFGKKARYLDTSRVQIGKDMAFYTLMAPFSAAENFTRRGAALAARNAAESRGTMSEAGVEAFTRAHIDDTQFQYFDMALPPFMKGSLARIAFQFAHFPANALKYEKDLFVGANLPGLNLLSTRSGELRGQTDIVGPDGNVIPASAAARKALAYHLGIIGLGGGVAGLALRPLLAPLSWMIQAISKMGGDDEAPDVEQWLMNNFGNAYNRALQSPADGHVGDPEIGEMRNLMLYGVPGLLGLQLSQRMGVSGLDVNPSRLDDLILGPTGGLYRDMLKGFTGDGGFLSANPEAAVGTIPVAGALSLAAGRVAGAPLPIPHKLATFSLASAYGLSRMFGEATTEQFKGSVAGKTLESALTPTIVEAALATQDIFGNEAMYDRNNIQRQYGSTFNKAFEVGSRVTGFQRIETAEERALVSYIRGNTMTKAQRTRLFVEMIASAVADAPDGWNNEKVAGLFRSALAEGLEIEHVQIERHLRRRSLDPVLGALEGVDTFNKREGRFLPWGQRDR